MYEVDCMTFWVVLVHLIIDSMAGSLSGGFFVTLIETNPSDYTEVTQNIIIVCTLQLNCG